MTNKWFRGPTRPAMSNPTRLTSIRRPRGRTPLRVAQIAAMALALAATGGPGFAASPSAGAQPTAASSTESDCPSLLRHTLNSLQTGQSQSLCQYRGKVLVIVNTASFCGYTYQYEGLEALYRKYKDRGLVVLGFPSNDYGSQEPGTNKEIAEFCRTTYGVQFPMFEKAAGSKLVASPVYAELIARTGQPPKWNFHKYVVDRGGTRIQSFGSDVEPTQSGFVGTIEKLLAEKPAS
jgi:glutathione peroxidase